MIGCLALAFGGILAFGLMQMDGLAGKAGWRWIFIIEGIVSPSTQLRTREYARILTFHFDREGHLRGILWRLLLLGRFPRKSPHIMELSQSAGVRFCHSARQ